MVLLSPFLPHAWLIRLPRDPAILTGNATGNRFLCKRSAHIYFHGFTTRIRRHPFPPFPQQRWQSQSGRSWTSSTEARGGRIAVSTLPSLADLFRRYLKPDDVLSPIHEGIFILNICLLLPILTASMTGLDSTLINGLQILPEWQKYVNYPSDKLLGAFQLLLVSSPPPPSEFPCYLGLINCAQGVY